MTKALFSLYFTIPESAFISNYMWLKPEDLILFCPSDFFVRRINPTAILIYPTDQERVDLYSSTASFVTMRP